MNSPRGSRPHEAVRIWEDHSDAGTGDEVAAHSALVKSETVGNDTLPFDSDDQTDVDIVESIEEPNYRWKISFEKKSYAADQRHISTNTAIRLHDDEDPFLEEDEEEDDEEDEHEHEVEIYEEEESFDGHPPAQAHGQDYRNVSNTPTLSTMPDELEMPREASPRSPSSRFGSPATNRVTEPKRVRQRFPRDRLLSSPAHSVESRRQYSPAPTAPNFQQDRYVSSPLAQRHTPSGFRNPSSVRAMQMASPSPPPGVSPKFAQSPRSARQRRMEMDDMRSASGTPSGHAEPKKEYPLILLHCSFTPVLPPYPVAVLEAILPTWVQENLALLHEKVSATVVERGILIPHPGEDYELLEERILESLELKKPRVSKCGHFLGHHSEDETAGASRMDLEEVVMDDLASLGDEKCLTCSKPVASGHRGCAGDAPHRRWDIRVYAANGLMRAGAWNAAWREMEKVDLEIGVWMPEEVRKQLEEESIRRGRERNTSVPDPWNQPEGYAEGDGAYDLVGQANRNVPPAPTPPRFQAREIKSDIMPASTAACSKPQSAPRERRRRTRAVMEEHGKVPLSTLLHEYVKRRFAPTRELMLQVVIVVLGIVVLRQWSSGASVSLPTESYTSLLPANGMPAALPMAVDNISVLEATQNKQIVESMAMPACTFRPADAGAMGFTALPSAMAQRVIDAANGASSIQSIVMTEASSASAAGHTPTVLGTSSNREESASTAEVDHPVPFDGAQEAPEETALESQGFLAAGFDLVDGDAMLE